MSIMRRLMITLTLGFVALFTLGNTGCDNQDSRQSMTSTRESNMDRAIRAVPVPQIHNYAARSSVARQVERMDQVGKLYYIYVMAQHGNMVGYYVADSRPVSVCSTLTPVDDVRSGGTDSSVVTKAPGLQGTYGGADCDRYFFFDAQTKAYAEIPSRMMLVFDAPLNVKVEQITVAIAKQ